VLDGAVYMSNYPTLKFSKPMHNYVTLSSLIAALYPLLHNLLPFPHPPNVPHNNPQDPNIHCEEKQTAGEKPGHKSAETEELEVVGRVKP